MKKADSDASDSNVILKFADDGQIDNDAIANAGAYLLSETN
jgi:hypothetical protein